MIKNNSSPFSVLLSLYIKEHAEYLRKSLESVFNQTLMPNEVILVLDGPITNELYEVVNLFKKKYEMLHVIPLKANGGLGRALNEGLKYCTNELVVRMDTDDIAKSYRFERLVDFMESRPDIAACSSWIEEFIDSPQNVIAVKKLPELHKDLVIYGKKRSPLNHPAVIFRKSAVQEVGGYVHFPLFEDYYLWARMLNAGMKMHNLQESLLYFRASMDMYKRRGGWKYAKDELRLQNEFKKMGFISTSQYIRNVMTRFGIRIMPNSARKFIYQKLLRF